MSYYSSLYVVHSPYVPKVKTCSDCKYYVNNTQKCSKFVYMNIVTAEKVYLDAKIMRAETSFCGFGGVHYEYDPKKHQHMHDKNMHDKKNEKVSDLTFENYEPTAVD